MIPSIPTSVCLSGVYALLSDRTSGNSGSPCLGPILIWDTRKSILSEPLQFVKGVVVKLRMDYWYTGTPWLLLYSNVHVSLSLPSLALLWILTILEIKIENITASICSNSRISGVHRVTNLIVSFYLKMASSRHDSWTITNLCLSFYSFIEI